MLAANEAVAEHFVSRGMPTVHRFHGEPDAKKLQAFAELAGAFGFQLKAKGGKAKTSVTPQELSSFLRQLEGHPEQRALNQLLLRSMMQAVYSVEQRGHYGLAAEHYLHFTSPIRRYPDLLVHRLLWKQWRARGARSGPPSEREVEMLSELAAHSSTQERAAMDVEREVVSFYAALIMQERVGEEFDGAVFEEISSTHYGRMVHLDDRTLLFASPEDAAEYIGFDLTAPAAH